MDSRLVKVLRREVDGLFCFEAYREQLRCLIPDDWSDLLRFDYGLPGSWGNSKLPALWTGRGIGLCAIMREHLKEKRLAGLDAAWVR